MMRMVLALALVVLGGLAAYVSGPDGLHAENGMTVVAGQTARKPGTGVLAVEELPLVGEPPATEQPPAIVVPVSDTGVALQAVAEEAAAVAPVAQRPLDLRVIMSGHSLTDPMRQTLPLLVEAAGGPGGVIAASTIPGAPLDWRWNNRTPAPDAREDIADFDVMVQTERVSLSGTRPWHNSDDEALRWARHGWENGAGGQGAEVLLYASWVSLDIGLANDTRDDEGVNVSWRTELDSEFASWEEIMAHVNAHRTEGAPQMRMIPATLIMAALYDAIAEGTAPEGLADIRQLFTDDIHLSPLGAWLVALTHYAVIYARDPRGLPGPEGAAPELVDWAQALVWEVVTGYPGTGVRAGN